MANSNQPAPRRGLRVAALGNPYRSDYANHEKNTAFKQTETTTPQTPFPPKTTTRVFNSLLI
ncbi:hypothetical protein RCS94_00575 [Orbaceae bacterium ac157xtp]